MAEYSCLACGVVVADNDCPGATVCSACWSAYSREDSTYLRRGRSSKGRSWARCEYCGKPLPFVDCERHFRVGHGSLVRDGLRYAEQEALRQKMEDQEFNVRGIPTQQDSAHSAPGMGRRSGSRARRHSG